MLPRPLLLALEEIIQNETILDLKKSASFISEKYRNSVRDGRHLVINKKEVLSYALTRMPATFEVISTVFKQIPNIKCQTLIDVGAGTGTGAYSALSGGYVNKVICLERENEMRRFGENLTKDIYPNIDWLAFDLAVQDINQKADIVLASYVLNELAPSKRISAIEKMWNATQKFLILIDNGTPSAFEMMKKIRTYLIKKGAFMLAPCTHASDCMNKWCHFSIRVQRTKIHRILKGGEAPFEDEKFCYLIFSKVAVENPQERILRHPQIEKGKITLQVCSPEGIKEKIITKKESNLFKKEEEKAL